MNHGDLPHLYTDGVRDLNRNNEESEKYFSISENNFSPRRVPRV